MDESRPSARGDVGASAFLVVPPDVDKLCREYGARQDSGGSVDDRLAMMGPVVGFAPLAIPRLRAAAADEVPTRLLLPEIGPPGDRPGSPIDDNRRWEILLAASRRLIAQSVWKAANLVDASLRCWAGETRQEFNPHGAITSARAALEEAARFRYAAGEISGALDADPPSAALVGSLDLLARLGELPQDESPRYGLYTGNISGRIGELWTSLPRSVRDACVEISSAPAGDVETTTWLRGLYGYLCDTAHPRSEGRLQFNSHRFEAPGRGTYRMYCRTVDGTYQGSIDTAWLAALAVAAHAAVEGQRRLEDALLIHAVTEGLDLRAGSPFPVRDGSIWPDWPKS